MSKVDVLLEFDKEYLRELYETSTTTDKKHRFQPQIVEGYLKCLFILEKVEEPEELYAYNSLHFEALRGNKNGLFSIRVNRQYRVEFEIREVIEKGNVVESEVHICNIVELSNHYSK